MSTKFPGRRASMELKKSIIRRSFLFCAFILSISLGAATAQAVDLRAGGGGGFMIGTQWLELGDLNRDLRTGGYDTFNESSLFYGGAGYGFIGERLVFGGEGGGFSQEASTGSYLQRLEGGYGMFTAGYVVFSRWGFNIFPQVGLGWGGVSLRITERSVPTFDEILAIPTRESYLSAGNFMMQGALGIDYRLNLRVLEKTEGEGGLLFGVRFGYGYTFGESDWSMGEINVVDGPDVGINGFFIRFLIGGWGVESVSRR
jgi:hypothetical protein